MFQKLEENIILLRKGTYTLADVYERNGQLFAGKNGRFVRIYANGSTSDANVQATEMTWEGGPLYRDSWGRLCCSNGDGRQAVENLKLLGQGNDGKD